MCRDGKYYSPTVTAVMLPEGHDADAFRALALEHFNISYGASFGRYAGKYLDKADYRVYVLLGDGESAEGSVWEAAQAAAQP